MAEPAADFGMLYLASPALPIGGFAYSTGLESAIERGWVSDAASLQAWVELVISQSLVRLDLPLLQRFYQAWQRQDQQALQRWNDYLLASRETQELEFEDLQQGLALQRLLRSLQVSLDGAPSDPSLLLMFSRAALHLGLSERQGAQAWLWSWLENQVAVASKTIPLGQTQAQQVLMALLPQLATWLEQAAALEDEHLGGSLPGVVMASSWHETQYSRLFRS